MLNNNSRLQYLLQQYANDSCTRKELLELLQAINKAKEDSDLQDSLEGVWNKMTGHTVLPDIDREAIFNQIVQVNAQNQQGHNSKRSNSYSWIARVSAAVLLLLLAIGLYPYIASLRKENARAVGYSSTIEVVPGGDKAILTLSDGSTVMLDAMQNGELATEDMVQLLQTEQGQLIYRGSKDGHVQQEMAYNSLTTPRGGQYRLVLDDGTRVWLNASSSIRYPISFTGRERQVKLTGEAYFEVAEDKEHPFVVTVDGTRVEVLGTHFNVMAYPDEVNISTTLLEGAVKMVHDKEEQLLLPGQQAIVGNKIELFEVDPKKVIAWKNGNFNFAGEHIETIMRKIARWYNIDVVYVGNLSQEKLIGTVPRSENLHEVLNTLELTGLVHFKVEGRRVTVMP